MDELLGEFLTETNESLDVIDVELVTLEKNPDNPEILSNIFRLVHTIKGTCGFLGLPRLESVAHAAENVLGKIRDGEMSVSSEVVTLVLEALDRIKEILADLAATETEPQGDDSDLIARLDAMAIGGVAPAAEAAAPEPEPEPEPVVPDDVPADVDAVAASEAELGRPLKPGEVTLDELERIFLETPGPQEDAPEPVAASAEAPPPPPPPAQKKAAPAPAAQDPDGARKAAEPPAAQTIRVNVDLLEDLMTMVSELVLTRNQLLQLVRNQSDSEFAVPLQALSHVTSELQESVMKTRMQPIGSAWGKLPRIIRDLSTELGKKIELDMRGSETELDRQVLELIRDPLTHMVRNSADHGLERPADRVAAGKPETGRVVLNAYHEGGHIIIEISDDGAGINVNRVKEKALANGLATAEELESMPDSKAFRFIFAAGFSTAQQVTSVSGRGVGMDVVRTNIEKIGGTVDVRSQQGRGSTFTIKIPLTLAIVSALVVECAGERFAIPQISVSELVRASKDSEHRIETINETPVLRLRDRLLPLVYLEEILKLEREAGDDRRMSAEDAVIVVTQVGNYRFGIVVDGVFDSEEIVVKPVAPIISHIKQFSGNTILGDGSVIMILDPNGIAETQGEISIPELEDEDNAAGRRSNWGEERESLLVFRAGDSEPKAVPLSLVARLEEIDAGKIEHSNGRMVVQYRGRLMPLVEFAGSFSTRAEGMQPVIVFTDESHSMGLLVDEIVDIVEDHLDIELSSGQPGLIGSAVIAGKATGIVDTAFYLTQAFGEWFVGDDQPFGEEEHATRILLVDDSRFFRDILTPVLVTAGYEVATADSADRAMVLCEQGERFDLIISDIEMPGMNGFEFAEEVRRSSAWRTVPMVALSSHATAKDRERGHAAGFNEYVAKHDRDTLLNVVAHTVASSQGVAA
jgi:two-component system chemotaxis sensor kinase CheA